MDYEKLKDSIIRFTAISGDQRGSDAFSAFVTGPGGIAWTCVEHTPKVKYGTGIDIILMMFSIRGSHDWFTMPSGYRLGPYGAKERAMRFAVPIEEPKLSLLAGTPAQRNALFAEMFDALASAVNKRKFADTIDFDKQLFLGDLKTIIESLRMET